MLMCIKENCFVCLRSYFWFYILKQLMMFDHFKTVVSFGICLIIRKIVLTSSPTWWWEKSTSEIDLSYLEWLVWLERLVFGIACMGGLDISTNLESGALLSFSLSNCWFHRQERILTRCSHTAISCKFWLLPCLGCQFARRVIMVDVVYQKPC
jgi:hypothetical protein